MVAGLLSLVVPGLGQVYAGAERRAFVAWPATEAMSTVFLILFVREPGLSRLYLCDRWCRVSHAGKRAGMGPGPRDVPPQRACHLTGAHAGLRLRLSVFSSRWEYSQPS